MRKIVVLLFHHGIACSLCREKLRRFSEHYSEFTNHEAEVIAISSDSTENIS